MSSKGSCHSSCKFKPIKKPKRQHPKPHNFPSGGGGSKSQLEELDRLLRLPMGEPTAKTSGGHYVRPPAADF